MIAEIDINTVRQRVQQAGVVGAGGAGFPTHIKLNANAEIYLVNGAECEPLLKVDQQLAASDALLLVHGLQYAMMATGAKQGIIALKAKYHSAIDQLTPLLPPEIRLFILPDIYPAGDEVITIRLATGRRVAPGALPLSVGVVVNNTQTVINIAKAVEKQTPVTERTLTINGAVKNPVTVTLPIGSTFADALALAGGATIDHPAYINGGPMMGRLMTSLDEPITKTTGGLLVLPHDHLLIQRRMRSDKSILNMANTVCEQCSLCTELCPRHLIGHELSPHLIIRGVNYQAVSKPSVLLASLTCSECGVCEAYACPVGISPLRVNQLLKSQLRREGLRYQGELAVEDPMFMQRLLPVSRLVSRLALESLNFKAPLMTTDWQPKFVVIPLQQHIGAPATATVQAGDKVAKGQLLAEMAEGQLGAAIHASISGYITKIDHNAITICQES